MGRYFVIPIEVREIPARAEFIPISVSLSWDSLLKQGGLPGAVDEHSLCLYRAEPGGKETEEIFQYSPGVQGRYPERRLLPETPESVSWVGEWSAEAVPASLRGSGTLTWIVKGGGSPSLRYNLYLRIPSQGRFIQVPYPPYNLRYFDSQGNPTPVRWFPNLQIRPLWPLGGTLSLLYQGKPLTFYHLGPSFSEKPEGLSLPPFEPRRPYFYPVYGPGNTSFTELGKPHDPTGSHAHHYSLWIAHADIAGKDFWSERGGWLIHQQFDLMEDGPLFARFLQRIHWTYGEQALLKEKRQVTYYLPSDSFRLIDLELELTPTGGEPLILGKTPFGFLAVRVAQSLTVFDGSGEILTSEGYRNEEGALGKRSAWLDLSGPIGQSSWGGVAILDHPDNPRYPTFWHCRNDGWAGAAFNYEDPWVLEPGYPLHLRYRILLHQHNAKEGEVARRYEEFICRPKVLVAGLQPVEQRDHLSPA